MSAVLDSRFNSDNAVHTHVPISGPLIPAARPALQLHAGTHSHAAVPEPAEAAPARLATHEPAAASTALAEAKPATADADVLKFVASTNPKSSVQSEPTAAPCVIPQAISFRGEATFRTDAVIEGRFEGTVRVGQGAKVTVSDTGMVQGEIHGRNVHVDGTVDGQIHATGGLASFGASAHCTGQIHYSRLAIEEGAVIEASMKRVQQPV